ncbi:TlpA disulfide reductase family protein [Streptomyces sp. NPDC005438]|uniref:TlpA family protein disulfide reductase n=1 Tax=Streptomyces sp. NPDC005438 TaxID=3156880 RepID=UPI0033BD9BF0
MSSGGGRTVVRADRSRRRAGRVRGAVAVVLGGVLVLTGCGDDKAGKSSSDTKIVEGTGKITTVPVADRKKVPDLAGETVDGKHLRVADYRGQVVVLNVWGSWCAPCRAEAPNLAKVAKETKGKGVQFVGINTRDLDKANAKAFDRNFGITYPSLFDPSGKLQLKFGRGELPPQSVPSTVVIDRKGRIAARALLALSEKKLRSILEPVMAEK